MFKFKMSLLFKSAKFRVAVIVLAIAAVIAGIVCIPRNKARDIAKSACVRGMPTGVTVAGKAINVTECYPMVAGYETIFCIEQDARLSYKQYTNPIDFANAQNYFTNYNSASWLLNNMYISNVTGANGQTLLLTNLGNIVTSESVKANVKSKYGYDGTNVTTQKILALQNKKIGGQQFNRNAIETVEQIALWKYTKNATNNVSDAYSNPNNLFENANLTADEQTTLKYLYYALITIADSKAGVSTPGTINNVVILNKNEAKFNEANYLVGPYYLESNGVKLTSYDLGGNYPITITVTKNDGTTAQLGAESVNKNNDGSFYINLSQFKDNVKKVDFTISNVLATITTDVHVLEGGAEQNLITIEKIVTPGVVSDSKNIEITPPAGKYTIVLNKVKADGTTVITSSEATFTINGTDVDTKSGVLTVVENKNIENENQKDSYKIVEKTAPEGFTKFNGELNLDVAFKLNKETKKYLIDSEKTTGTGFKDMTRFEVSPDGTKITVYVVNTENGKYSVELYKTDENGKIITTPATFNVNNVELNTKNGRLSIASEEEITKESQSALYIIKESKAPENYYIFDGTISLGIKMKKDGDKLTIDENKIDFKVDGDTSKASFTVEGTTIKVYVKNTRKIFDLSLRKYISKINGKNVEPSREPVIDAESIKELEATGTAIYHHAKNSLLVNVGDEVEYTIRVYNEGEILGHSKQITDYLPEGLTFVRMSEDNSKEYTTKTAAGSKIVVIDYSGNTDIKSLRDFIGKDSVKVTSDYYQEVKMICKVEDTNTTYITNRSEITNYGYNENGAWVEANKANVDKDSVEGTIAGNLDLDNWYVNAKTYNRAGKSASDYYPGVQDDDDFETVQIMRGAYSIVLRKVDESNKDNGLAGAYFTVDGKEYGPTGTDGYLTIVNGKEIKPNSLNTTMSIVETKAPENYKGYAKEIKLNVVAKADGSKYVLDKDNTKLATSDEKVTIDVNEEKSLITITIPNTLKDFDLSLRKFITAVNGVAPAVSREPVVDITKLASGEATTATYTHPKNPLDVATNDVVTYTIRVYNEGEIDGYAAQVMDDIPEGLEFIPGTETNKIWTMYKLAADSDKETVEFDGKKYVKTENAKEAKIIVTEALSKANGEDKLIKAFDGKELKFQDLKVDFKVVEPNNSKRVLTNYAQITKHTDANGKTIPDVTDRDSTPNKWVEGEDDQDIENIKLKEFDLALRKFIVAVNGVAPVVSREPKVDTTKLANGEATTATYTHPKNPLDVATSDVVTYTLRIYNEGGVDGYAEQVIDDIPDGLEFIPGTETNKIWKTYRLAKDSDKETVEFDGKKYVETKNAKEAKIIVTDALSKANGEDNLIKAFDGKTLSFKDVKVDFKVVEPNKSTKVITNYAQITKHTDRTGTPVVDRDSTPNKWVEGEDDQDIENIKLKEFDLALRKFISAVNSIAPETSREPKVDTTKLVSGESTTAIYSHPKDPLDVNTTDIVTYTLRIYNEGGVDGYAEQVIDDIPEGLEFVPGTETNNKYKWVLYKEVKDGKDAVEFDGKKYVKTENAKEADIIVTDYLSKANNKDNLIKAFDGKTVSFKDVKVDFKVVEPTTSDRIITNYAQITKHTDKTGTPVVDRDSTPNKWIKGEDDQDIENIRVRYFDLSLLKYVTKAIVYENGGKNVIETGHTGYEQPEPVVKVDLKNTDINKVTVKFEYTIKITNDGQIEGYAKEISDYIPAGLKFVAEDNKDWKEVDGKVVTDQLKDTLLQPNESAEVTIILTWINGSDNMGVKTNVAEISKDYNKYGTPDIDSTPNNKVEGEDDIDNAPVMLTVRTGMPKQYYGVIFGVLVILTAGVVAIKKKVIA